MDLLTPRLKSHGIGLTGGVATGKSTVAALIARAGWLVLDADQMSRETTAPGTPGLAALAAAFGAGILDSSGALDRKALGRVVFADPLARRRLEALTHPMIRARLLERLEAEGLARAPRRFFYEAALLFETGTAADFGAVWVTWCPPDVQLARLMARGGLPRAEAERIIAAQMPADAKKARADVVIDTSGTLADVERRVGEALATLR